MENFYLPTKSTLNVNCQTSFLGHTIVHNKRKLVAFLKPLFTLSPFQGLNSMSRHLKTYLTKS
jgi:hypothetical protein